MYHGRSKPPRSKIAPPPPLQENTADDEPPLILNSMRASESIGEVFDFLRAISISRWVGSAPMSLGRIRMKKGTSRLRFRIAVALAVAVGALAAIMHSAGAAEVDIAPPASVSSDEAVQTQHSITLDGVQLAYTATTGRLRVGLDRSDAEALVFYVSYDKDGENAATRPITFVFNGGPGSSAAWLHLGALGPRRLALSDEGAIPEAPARLADNAQTWLRFTDLVFIDPVGTGFSRAIGSAEKSSSEVGRRFWSIRSDLRSLAEFMRVYLTRKQRWASPKYLAGESYGGCPPPRPGRCVPRPGSAR